MGDLPLRRFRDELGTGEAWNPKTGAFETRRGRSAESQAAEYLLEHRRGPRSMSVNAPERMMLPDRGQAHAVVDIEATCDVIEAAAGVVPVSWRAPVLVSLAWAKGVKQLREPEPDDGPLPYLVRAGFAFKFPAGFGRWGLHHHAAQFRGALVAHGLVVLEGDGSDDDGEPSEQAFSPEERMAEHGEVALVGYRAIGKFLGVSEKTVRRWAKESTVPLHQRTRGGTVTAFPSELDAWKATWHRNGAPPVRTGLPEGWPDLPSDGPR